MIPLPILVSWTKLDIVATGPVKVVLTVYSKPLEDLLTSFNGEQY